MKLKNSILILATLHVLASCAPVPVAITKTPPGPPDFQAGYDDGCESGLAAFGNSYYKTFYQFKKKFDAQNDALYQNGWEKGYQYCRQYAMKWTHGPLK